MRLIDADALKYKNVAEVNGILTHILTAEEIDHAPTVEYPFYQEAYQTGYEEGKNERPHDRDCEHCAHCIPAENGIMGCESWECEFKPKGDES